ncbi:MAG TPA: RNA methyltransferase [Usitatibacter sp.]|jgi:TrmH family RNA methyltransferase|nr:RNA methyltransferase [Usitatibacter sp.]
MKAIGSRDNLAYKRMARLYTSGQVRRAEGMSLLDGAHLVDAYLGSGREIAEIAVNAAGLGDAEIAGLVQRASPAKVTLLSDPLFKSISTVDSPTGIVAFVKTPGAAMPPVDAPLVLALEDIQDPGNVGTLLRSAAAAGASHVVLSARCAFAWSPKVLRAAMGAHFAVGIAEGVDLAAFAKAFRGTVIALSGASSRSLYDLDLRGPCAIFVGNEGSGLSAELEAAAQLRVRIPMPGRVESLNAAVAGSLALFECVRQRVVSKALILQPKKK